MKNKFPYPGTSKKVTEDMCDLNGHMNVTFYTKIFEEGSYELFNKLGMGFDYIESGFSTFEPAYPIIKKSGRFSKHPNFSISVSNLEYFFFSKRVLSFNF